MPNLGLQRARLALAVPPAPRQPPRAAATCAAPQAEPFVVEALFPLFELLHHYWINQADRDGSLQELARLLAPAVFGTPAEHGLLAEDGGLLSDTVEMLISEYRPLFTQPFNLRRYEADAARQAAAEAQRAEAAAAASPPLPASPLLTPIRCQRLSVMGPEGDSPFSDCCGTPLPPDSPFSAYVAADGAAASPPFGGFRGPSLEGGGAAAPHPASAAAPAYDDDQHLEQTFSDLLECTVSGMLFDVPPTPPRGAHGDGEACYGSAPLAGGVLMGDTELACAGDQPMSPVAVLRDGGDESTDGSGACLAACGLSAGATAAGNARRLGCWVPAAAQCAGLGRAWLSPAARDPLHRNCC